jgi:preprotein translocase subunit SecD
MIHSIRVQFTVVALLAALAAFFVAPLPNKPKALAGIRLHPGMDLAGGAELRYKVLFQPGFAGDREQAARSTADVVRRRLEAKLLRELRVTTHGADEIVVQMPGADAGDVEECKRLLRTTGDLRLYAAAPAELQERYERDGILPEGFDVVRGGDGAPILIEKPPVIEGRQIVDAEPHQELVSGDLRWVTLFELDAEGARRFDDAAGRLYHRSPRGRMVIVLDGKVRSAPVVQSPEFHGRGRISSPGF